MTNPPTQPYCSGTSGPPCITRWGLIVPVFIVVVLLTAAFKDATAPAATAKIGGINLVAPPNQLTENPFDPALEINAGWTSVIPYGYSRPGRPQVTHNLSWQWWGETHDGAAITAEFAKEKGLKVMLKPQIWVSGQGWAGDYNLNSEAAWKTWEKEYEGFIIPLAKIADSLGIEMICIGTEYKNAAHKRPEFWRSLIRKIRGFYDGKLTYAANWDNYRNIPFWNELDYIGIDAYFPLSNNKTPSLKVLLAAWEKPHKEIKIFQKKINKPVLFTEYGYRSVDGTAWEQWQIERDRSLPHNMQAQVNAYEAIYRTFWNEPWFAGGFIWHWFAHHDQAGGKAHNGYTPQNKPASRVITKWYENK